MHLSFYFLATKPSEVPLSLRVEARVLVPLSPLSTLPSLTLVIGHLDHPYPRVFALAVLAACNALPYDIYMSSFLTSLTTTKRPSLI